MKTDSPLKISSQWVLGIAAICVVAGIVCGMAGFQTASAVLVGAGVFSTALAAIRSKRLTIW